MSGQVTITQLPSAAALTGSESVPIVQNGVTVQTTTSAISGAGALNYPFLTVGTTAGLTQARYVTVGTGLTTVDGGAGTTFAINMTGAASSLNSASNGLIVKTGTNTVTNRSIAVGSGMTVSNADGISGNPTLGLSTNLQNLSSLSGTGLMTINGTTFSQATLQGTINQINIANPNAVSGTPTFSIASDPVLSGTGGLQVPSGTNVQRLSNNGVIRYNTDLSLFEFYQGNSWTTLSANVSSFSAGTTGLTPSSAQTGVITLGGVLNVSSGGTGATTLSGVVYGNGTSAFTAATGTQISTAIGSTYVTNATNATNAVSATSATTATNIAGGANLRIPYQTASGATTFIIAPTVAGTYLSYTGSTFSWTTAGGGGGSSLTVGSTGILSGTSGRILYDNLGVLGELATTGTGTVVLSSAPTITTSLGVTGQLLLSGANTGTQLIATNQSANILNIGGTSATGNINLGQSTATQTVNIASGNTNSGQTSTVNIAVPASSGSGAGVVNIATGNYGFSNNVNIGANTGILTIYSDISASPNQVSINSAVGDLNLNTAGLGTNTTIGSGDGSVFTVNHSQSFIASGLINVGSSISTSSINGSTINVGTSQTTGTITIGGASQTGTLQIGQSTSSQPINIGGIGAASGQITIGRGTTAGAQTVQIGSSGTIVNIGATSGVQTLTLGRSVQAQTVNINNGTSTGKTTNIASLASTGTNTVTIGSTSTGDNVLNLCTGTGAQTLNIANGLSNLNNKTIDIGSGSGYTTITLANTASYDVEIGGYNTNGTINIATGGTVSSAQAITIGSTVGSSTTTHNGTNNFSALTASQAVFTDASKNLVSKATTGANSVVLRDANQNISSNNFLFGFTSTASAGTTTVLTAASTEYQLITGSTSQTFQLPNATTLVNGTSFIFNNNSSAGTVTINNGAVSPTLIASVGSGGYITVTLLDNTLQAGSWDYHYQAPSNTSWSTNTLSTGSAITSTQTVQGTRLISTIATGTAPLTVTSTTQVANLNAAIAGTVTLAAGTGATNYIPFAATATGNQALTTNTLLTYNYTNNTLTAGISGGAF